MTKTKAKPNATEWTVGKVKTFMGREGHGFNAELRYQGEPVCFIINNADGGDFRWQWVQAMSDVKEKLAALVKSLPKWIDKDLFPEGIEQNEDMWLEALVNRHAIGLKLKDWCKKNVVFTLDGDAEGTYRKCKFKGASDYRRVLEAMKIRYKDRTMTVINDTYL